MLNVPCGQKVAEKVVRRNAENVKFHFPQKVDHYSLVDVKAERVKEREAAAANTERA